MLAKSVYKLGARIRNPSLDLVYRSLKSSEWVSREALDEIQLQKCKEFLEFAGKFSPYYRKLYDAIDFNPSEMVSVDEIKKIPPIDKAELIARNSEIHSVYEFPKTFMAETSGTSGQALEFRRDEVWDSMNRAAVMRAYDWYGVKPWDRNGYLWGYNIDWRQKYFIYIQDFLQNRFRCFSYSNAGIDRFVKKLNGAKYISGYSSMIYEVAKRVKNLERAKKIGLQSVRMIKGTSETIQEVYKSECLAAFGVKLISEYGAAESGLIAFECPHGSMHINVENLYLEEVGGEILVTNLVSRSFPIIRYKLGDSAIIQHEGVCACGRSHPILKEVIGRNGVSIIGSQHKYPGLTFYYVFKNMALEHGLKLNYHALQKTPGVVNLYIEQQKGDAMNAKLLAQLYKYFKNDVEFNIDYGFLPRHEGRKSQYFVSMIED